MSIVVTAWAHILATITAVGAVTSQIGSGWAVLNETIASGFGPMPDVTIAGTCVVLLTVASPRNIHLSDRSRANVSEVLYVLLPELSLSISAKRKRLVSLRFQTMRFDKRYTYMSHAFALLVMSMLGYIGAALCAFDMQATHRINAPWIAHFLTECSGFLTCTSVVPLGWASFYLLTEFWRGPITLRENSRAFRLGLEALGGQKAERTRSRNLSYRLSALR